MFSSKKIFFLSLIAVILMVGNLVPMTAAQDETLTVLCSPHDDWCKAMVAAFEAETGIDTTYVRMSSGDALNHVRDTADGRRWGRLSGLDIRIVDRFDEPEP